MSIIYFSVATKLSRGGLLECESCCTRTRASMCELSLNEKIRDKLKWTCDQECGRLLFCYIGLPFVSFDIESFVAFPFDSWISIHLFIFFSTTKPAKAMVS